MVTTVLVTVALFCIAASVSWIRSSYYNYLHWRQIRNEVNELKAAQASSVGAGEEVQETPIETESDVAGLQLAKIGLQKAIHSAFLYVSLGVAILVIAVTTSLTWEVFFVILLLPAILSIYWASLTKREFNLTEKRLDRERRAEATLTQDRLAPRAWADRLAPEELPEFEGLEVAKIYQAGSGLIAGDFYDLFRVSENRLAAVIGDVAGKDIESSITAFQAKYLLRVFLRQFRDPAQALEELNRQMAVYAYEDFVSIVVLIFDLEAGVLRYASAGHPTVWLWHDREVQPIARTGPVVMIDTDSTFYSREIALRSGDVVFMYTDGLSEVRKSSGEILGEEKVGDILRRDPNVAVDVMCKQILETAISYSEGPIIDDMAMMAIRLTSHWDNTSN